jgi:uroporphyrinogen decarboxylase
VSPASARPDLAPGPAYPVAPLPAGTGTGSPADSAFLRACRRQPVPHTPVWFMRQAGRSLPEYRALRDGVGMLESCMRADLVTEITLQPVRRYGVDAAIVFSDIVVPLKAVGIDLDIVPGVGPVVAQPIRSRADLARLRALEPDDVPYVAEAVRALVTELGPVPLIGFAGAPFTLASYLVEGGPSRDHLAARALMHADPSTWRALTEWAADVTGAFLRAQVLAGASAAQLFDSWAGSLSLGDYTQHVAPASTRALAQVDDLDVRTVHFGTGTGELLAAMRDVGADVVGVDYRIPLDEASRRLGGRTPVQGNIDPALLAAPWPVLEAHVRDVVSRGASAPAHVVNLGHGVPPTTDPDVLTRLVGLVHSL